MHDNTFTGSVEKDVNIFGEAFIMPTTMHFTVCSHTHTYMLAHTSRRQGEGSQESFLKKSCLNVMLNLNRFLISPIKEEGKAISKTLLSLNSHGTVRLQGSSSDWRIGFHG